MLSFKSFKDTQVFIDEMMRDLYFKIAGWGRGEKCGRIRTRLVMCGDSSKLNDEHTQLIKLFFLVNMCGNFSNKIIKLNGQMK